MELVVYLLLAVIITLLVFVLMKRQSPQASSEVAQPLLLVQQHVESLRNDLRESLNNITDNVNRQLATVTQQIQSQTSNVGSRLDNAANVIRDVQKNLGELGQATREIKELGQSVSKVEELLRAPKLRGGLGELLLEDLLKQVIPAEYVEMQYRFRNGQTVDAVVKTYDKKMVPIDSKFPLENFRKMIEAQSDQERKSFHRDFVNDVKKHIDSIAAKYILTDEGTFDFALMYIPAENVYYETIIKDESSDGGILHSYALEKHVVPVSPNSFYAYLRVIVLGLRGLQIEKSAKSIIDNLNRLQGEVGKVRDAFEVLGSHLDNARKKYEEADKRLTHFEDRLENIADRSVEPGEPRELLPEKS